MVFKEKEQKHIVICEEIDVLRARKAGRDMASASGFNDVKTTEIEIAISELGLNIIKHRAVRGELVLTLVQDEGSLTGFEIIARDHGPGISDPAAAMRDGESSTGTLGIGLSGVKRLMDEFSLNSELGRGTVVKVRKWLASESPLAAKFSVLSRPKFGESLSGDAYFIRHTHNGIFLAVVDALGHGSEANKTVVTALDILGNCYMDELPDIAATCHRGLRYTRGVALGLCRIRQAERIVEHLSIGNVELRVYQGTKERHTVCFNGTLGMETESYHVSSYPYNSQTALIMFSDGVSGKFKLSEFLLEKTPVEIASYIFRNYSRDYDDATVLVLK
jgi:anti-sigma regulatory factor (Ser/Thr protein kinase)